VSFSGSWQCSRSTGSGVGSDGGGCRQRAGAAVEAWRGGELGRRNGCGNANAWKQARVRGKLQDVLGVQKKAWSCGSRSWQAGGSRGVSGGRGATWRGEDRASARWEAAAQVLGWHVARGKAAWGRQVRGTWPARAAGVGRREIEEEGTQGRRRGICLQFPKNAGTPL
jgi:hypothetical protein